MAKKARKLFGSNPERVVIVSEAVDFDAEGMAEVSDELADVLAQIPGYEVLTDGAPKKVPAKAEEEGEDEADEKPTAPKKPAPKKPGLKKA